MRYPAILAAVLWLLLPPALAGAAETVPIAVLDFGFLDTSGEARDQQDEHQRRLRAMSDRLRAGLEAGGRLQVVPLACGAEPCTAEDARRAGARLLLIGEVQKTSTLILGLKARVLDLAQEKVVFDRVLSFRGDTDEAWERARGFLLRDLLAQSFE